jgi:trehalose synthase
MSESSLEEVELSTLDPEWFKEILEADAMRTFEDVLVRAGYLLEGRTLWHVNSTAQGGGVAEILHSALGYLAGAGIQPRWMVIGGNEEFFDLTKRIHNLLHGEPGDGGELGEKERHVYEETLRPQAEAFCGLVEPGDVVVVHDPQPVGVVPLLLKRDARVIWNCHVGIDEPNDLSRKAWDFLMPYVSAAHAQVFSREAYAWEGLSEETINVIPPCIDAFSPKNQEMDEKTVMAILSVAGIQEGPPGGTPTFVGQDGSKAEVTRRAEVVEEAPVPASAPLVVQVSRWDRLKDPIGVLKGFANHVARDLDAHLILAGPASSTVADDPEAEEVLAEVRKVWNDLPASARERAHLVSVPMDDLEENAAIVNALQRRASVIVQKSLAEGFGLTVAEGMWKERPLVGSRVGGIQDQIEHGRSGLLIDDPEDQEEFGAAVSTLLQDPERAARMGKAARQRVLDEYLPPRYLTRYIELIDRIAGSAAEQRS